MPKPSPVAAAAPPQLFSIDWEISTIRLLVWLSRSRVGRAVFRVTGSLPAGVGSSTTGARFRDGVVLCWIIGGNLGAMRRRWRKTLFNSFVGQLDEVDAGGDGGSHVAAAPPPEVMVWSVSLGSREVLCCCLLVRMGFLHFLLGVVPFMTADGLDGPGSAVGGGCCSSARVGGFSSSVECC